MFISNILASFIANLIFGALLFLVGLIPCLLIKRARLLNFFGLSKHKMLYVYISNISVIEGGSIGVDNVQRLYAGLVVTYGESLYANNFISLFNQIIPSLSNQYGVFKYLLLSDISTNIYPAHPRFTIPSNGTIVSIGSPGYNFVSGWIQNTYQNSIKFSENNTSFFVNSLPEYSSPRCGFIQRLIDSSNNRHIYYIAGINEYSTVNAFNYFTKNWKTFNKKYSFCQSFLVLVKFEDHRSEIILERNI